MAPVNPRTGVIYPASEPKNAVITTQIERWAANIPALERLFPEMYEELSPYKNYNVKPLANHAAYIALEQRGELLLVTLRENGQLAGLYSAFICKSMHYDMVIASQDLFYVRKETRKYVFGVYRRLLRAVEKELRRRGIKCWWAGTKVTHNASSMLEKCGFKKDEITLSKSLEK